MKIASVAEVKSHFSAFLKASGDGPVVVTRNGRPVAVLLSIEDEDELERLLLSRSPRFRAILEVAKQQVRDGLAIEHDRFWDAVASGADEGSLKPTSRRDRVPERRRTVKPDDSRDTRPNREGMRKP